MRSPKGFFGALAILLMLPVAVVCAVTFGDQETGLHLALAAGTWLLAAAVGDFDVWRPFNRATAVALGLLGGIFFLQAVTPLTRNDALFDFSYVTLGQVLEGFLTLWFVAWCATLLFSDSRGKTRLFGLATVLPLFAYVASAFVVKQAGGDLPGAFKLLFLPAMLWLLLEAKKPSAVQAAPPVAPRRPQAPSASTLPLSRS